MINMGNKYFNWIKHKTFIEIHKCDFIQLIYIVFTSVYIINATI